MNRRRSGVVESPATSAGERRKDADGLARNPGRTLLAIAFALLALQGGFYTFVAPLPIALGAGGLTDGEIGLIVGAASLVQIVAAPLIGPLIDRFGSPVLLYVAGACYVVSAAVLIGPLAEPADGGTLAILSVRALQGVGLAIALPAGLAMVPRIVSARRGGVGLGVVASSNNLALVALSPLALAVYRARSFQAVAVLAAVASLLAVVLFRAFVASQARTRRSIDTSVQGALGFRWRIDQEWLPILAALAMASCLWGVLVAHLPYRAYAAEADISLFFVAHGATILFVRVPAGWLLDRGRHRVLAFTGVAAGLLTCLLLLQPLTDLTLFASGMCAGASAGLVVTTLLVLLGARASRGDQGRAFALFSAALALGITAGSIATGPAIERAGLGAGLAAAALALITSGTIIERVIRAQERRESPLQSE